jgi:tRNA1Val (adenine37-N6)-methyltransferase
MPNDYFQFKQFTIRQDRCAMKVGTDGTLLGAWAKAPAGPCRVLDIGTGTGLIALMMAQRFPEAEIVGIDIDPMAVEQARENTMESPFADRISILEADVLSMESVLLYDAIVSNPPYFVDSLVCPDIQRTTARHTVSLTYEGLMKSAFRLLKMEGFFSVVIPEENRSSLESSAAMAGFSVSRVCHIRTTPRKLSKRCLIELRKITDYKIDISEGIIEVEPNVRSNWYQQLTNEFYLK